LPILGCAGYCDNDVQCDDKNACTTDTCTANKCKFANNTAACDDGNDCTAGDVCNGGACQVGAIVQVATIAGSVGGYVDATGTAAQLNSPIGVEVAPDGTVYIADTGNHRIRKQTPDGAVTTLAGSGSPGFVDAKGAAAWFNSPADVARDGKGNLYVADRDNHAIRKITTDGAVTGLAGGGAAGLVDDTGVKARFNYPYSLAVTAAGLVYVADYGNHRIRKVTAAGVVTTLAGSTSGYADGTGSGAKFFNPIGIAVDDQGNLYVGDYSNHRIRKVSPDGVVTTVAGSGMAGLLDGDAAVARFYYPWGVAVDSTGALVVADRYNYRLRRIANGLVTTWAGSGAGNLDGAGNAARFNSPVNLASDAHGFVYVADISNHRIRRVRDTAKSCAIAGSCWSSGLDDPADSCQVCDGGKSETQWTAKSDAAPCSDGQFCTVTDTCGSGTCSGAANSCDDGNKCTADSCDATTGACLHAAIGGCL
jgi:sugar lactone lactonase YvrE